MRDHQRAGADHRLERQVDDVRRRSVLDGELVEPGHLTVESSSATRSEPSHGIGMPNRRLAVDEHPAEVQRRVGPRSVVASSIAASFEGWSRGQAHAGDVADERLEHRGDGRRT